jgi:hypothetical protein
MSDKLEQWKRLTTIQVKNAGSISAATGLEMMFYIADLEQQIAALKKEMQRREDYIDGCLV